MEHHCGLYRVEKNNGHEKHRCKDCVGYYESLTGKCFCDARSCRYEKNMPLRKLGMGILKLNSYN